MKEATNCPGWYGTVTDLTTFFENTFPQLILLLARKLGALELALKTNAWELVALVLQTQVCNPTVC